ncbi:MAG TPA: hypothetical protein VMT58_01290 [Candidatus Binataceae bacterium]|nr:hypothetical protein [Candidatus Binataceae bacterium]
MTPRNFLAYFAFAILPFVAGACATAGAGALKTGMTPTQTIQAMGQPDLRDDVPDPNHSGARVLRYIWLDPGKAAVFSANDRVASIQDVESGTKKQLEEQQAHATPSHFDPVQTPLDYMFYPIKASFIYLGAGANCVGGGSCRVPKLPPPSTS